MIKEPHPSLRKRFLSFVTGSDLAPVGGLQELQLVIQRNGEEPTERLPTAHTCGPAMPCAGHAMRQP